VTHELATNAAKYGALSQKNAELNVTWRVGEDGAAELLWTETGGPTVTPPNRKGFGSILLTRSVPFDLGGESEITYAPEGLRARFLIPQRFVSVLPPPPAATEEASISRDAPVLDGLDVLLVEDQLIIALDAEAMLQMCGVGNVDTAATAAEALRVLVATTPDVAMLDVNLGSGNSFPVAEELERRKIPFIFATGYGDHVIIPRSLKHIPVVRKPYDPDQLAAGLARAIAMRREQT
ncbi:response regulator, partial [Terricaulis sp.]|uniref:response regulator n=1 Tax=Terricaulis sp. TaxID=2768686 RepID=UPI002AC69B59